MSGYLMWFDYTARRDTATKIAHAVDAYEARFHTHPNVVLVNEADAGATAPAGISVRAEPTILPNNYWVGRE